MQKNRRTFIKYSSALLLPSVATGCLGGGDTGQQETDNQNQNVSERNETQPTNLVFNKINAPGSVKEGEKFNYSVTVENPGNTQKEFSFVVNGNTIKTQSASRGSSTYTITVSSDMVKSPSINIGAKTENANISRTIQVQKEAPLEITQIEKTIQRNGFERLKMEGRVRNNGERNVKYIELRLTVYDNKNRALKTYRAIYESGKKGKLAPGQEWFFEIPVQENPDQVADYSAEILTYRLEESS